MNPLTTVKLIGAAILLALAVWGYIVISGWHDDSKKLPIVIAERDKAISDYNDYVKIRKAQDLITTQVSESYENAITDLVGQLNAARGSSIRVCKPALQSTPAPSSAASGPNETSPDRSSTEAEQVVSTRELYQIAGEAVECGERLNHLQEWIRQQNQLSSNP